MVRTMTRHLAKRGDFRDLSIGAEFYEEGGLLFATVTFSATKGTRRKTSRIKIDLNEALTLFEGDLPTEGKDKPLESPISIHPVPPLPIDSCPFCRHPIAGPPAADCLGATRHHVT